MKVYEIIINMEDTETGMMRNSFVNDPAVEYTKLDFNKEKTLINFSNIDNEQKFMSISMSADTIIPRKNPETGEIFGVIFTKESVNNIVNKFIMKGNVNEVSFQHTDTLIENVFLVEHFITKEGIKEAPFFKDLPDGSWVTTYYVPDLEQYNKLKDDKTFNGFSIELNALLDQYLFNIDGEIIPDIDQIKTILENDEYTDFGKEKRIKKILNK